MARLLDANLNRAREGLRVVEDWCRLVLQRPELVARLKDYRQRLGQCHSAGLKQARHAASDPATGLAHPAQQGRSTPRQVVAANCARVQEALRVLEEFGRHGAGELAATAAAIRYGLYDLETLLLAHQERHRAPAPGPLVSRYPAGAGVAGGGKGLFGGGACGWCNTGRNRPGPGRVPTGSASAPPRPCSNSAGITAPCSS